MEQDNKTIVAYKGFDKDLKCRDFQYEVGKEYKLPEGKTVKICSTGFHACESPLEVLDYYFLDDNVNLSRFCEVEQSGEISRRKNTTKVASSKIKIKAEITFTELIKLGIKWLEEKGLLNNNLLSDFSNDYAKIISLNYRAKINSSSYSSQIGSLGDFTRIFSSGIFTKIGSSGYYGQICSLGDCARIGSLDNYVQISSFGDNAQIVSLGRYSQISSFGDDAKIKSLNDSVEINSTGSNVKISSSGDLAKISSLGNYAQINSEGEDSIIICTGFNSKVKAKKGSWITLTEWDEDGSKCVKTEYVDNERIKEDTWYELVDGEFVEVIKL